MTGEINDDSMNDFTRAFKLILSGIRHLIRCQERKRCDARGAERKRLQSQQSCATNLRSLSILLTIKRCPQKKAL